MHLERNAVDDILARPKWNPIHTIGFERIRRHSDALFQIPKE